MDTESLLKRIEKEIKFYERIKPGLLEKGYSGKFVVIKGEEVIGIYESYEEAMKDAISKLGRSDMLVEEISEKDKIEEVYPISFEIGREDLKSEGPRLGLRIGPAFGKPETEVFGLIDTGASISCISTKVFGQLNYPIDGFRRVGGATGEGIFPTTTLSLSFVVKLKPFTALKVVILPSRSDFLIGREILSNWMFFYDGLKGKFSLEES